MKTISHPYELQLQSVVDENNPTIQRLLALSEEDRKVFFSQLIKDLLLPEVEKALKKLNKNNSFARLEVVA